MKRIEITVTNKGDGMEEALAETERLGLQQGLTSKEILRLRLLCEELCGMMRGIAGDVEAVYRVKADGKRFEIGISAEVEMTQEMKKQFINVSSDKTNSAKPGFMGKIRDLISTAFLPKESGLSVLSGFSLGCMSMGGNSSPAAQAATANAFYWSMNKYKDEIGGKEGAEDAWDELEKSIVANIADEIIVRVSGSNADIAIQKTF